MMIQKRSKHVGVILSVFMWNLYKCNCWLIIKVILRMAWCNSKVYTFHYFNQTFKDSPLK